MATKITLYEYLEKLRNLEKKATPGPWDKNKNIVMALIYGDKEDAEFIGASRQAIPKLIKIVEKMREALDIIANNETLLLYRWPDIERAKKALSHDDILNEEVGK